MNAGGVDKACKSYARCRAPGAGIQNDYTERVSYQQLRVYQEAQKLFPRVYRIVRSWSEKDQRELGSQLIRAANSIHANIAEGYGKSAHEFKRYLGHALGSCDEVKSHLDDAIHVSLIPVDKGMELREAYVGIAKQLYRLREKWS